MPFRLKSYYAAGTRMTEMTSAPESSYRRAYFHSRYSPNPGRDAVWKAIVAHLASYLPSDGSVLDLGAGYCSFINNVRAKEKHALDIHDAVTTYASPEVRAHIGSCTDLSPFPASSLDVVFASNLLEHLSPQDSDATLREVHRVLKPGGRLLLMQPNFRIAFREYFDDYTHVQIFTDAGLADLLVSLGYVIDKVEPRFMPFSFKSRLPAWGWLARLYLALPVRPFAKQMLLIARRGQ